MKYLKNKIEVAIITLKIYWTKFELWSIKQFIKLQNELNFIPAKYDKE